MWDHVVFPRERRRVEREVIRSAGRQPQATGHGKTYVEIVHVTDSDHEDSGKVQLLCKPHPVFG